MHHRCTDTAKGVVASSPSTLDVGIARHVVVSNAANVWSVTGPAGRAVHICKHENGETVITKITNEKSGMSACSLTPSNDNKCNKVGDNWIVLFTAAA